MKIVTSKQFEIFIPICIIANTILLAFDKYPNDAETVLILESLNFIFYVIFLIEMILKLIGLGLKTYFRDSANSFDMFVVTVSTFDVVFMFANVGSGVGDAI